jgi:4-hydroxy-2-oxoheptanedioate aldolase
MTAIEGLRHRLATGGPVFGAWSTLGSPLPAEILAQLGFDYVCVDLQHGLASLESAPPAIQGITAAGSVPFVRVPGNEPWLIMRALDLGSFGVVVPLVSTPEQAARAAAACRYPPDGARSWGPVRTAAALGATATERNEHVLCIGMIETVEGVANLEAICGTPGIDAIYVGPSDLGLSHGLPPGPELDGVIAGIAEVSKRCRVPAGIHARSGESARAAIDAGYTFATVSSDRDLLGRTARAELAAARGSEPEGREASDADLLRASASYT